MVFYPENAPHEGRPLLDLAQGLLVFRRFRPVRRQISVVTVFPAVSIGARTPGAHDVETYGLICAAQQDRPIQIETAALPLNRPHEGYGVGCSSQRQRGVRENKAVFYARKRGVGGMAGSRCSIPPYERRVEASIEPCTR